MVMGNWRRYLLVMVLTGWFGMASAQELRPRIAGMERDSSYMALLAQQQQRTRALDSLQELTGELRSRFQEEPEAREQLTEEILPLEMQQLKLGREQRKAADQIERLEQEWLLKHMQLNPEMEVTQPQEEPLQMDKLQPEQRYLTANSHFHKTLPKGEYMRLKQMQEQERVAAHLVELYAENYARLRAVEQPYLTTSDQHEADSLYEVMATLNAENYRLNDSLKGAWDPIFDHKSYAYAYLLDYMDLEQLLVRQIEWLNDAQREADSRQGEYASDALCSYAIEKLALVKCEMELASALELESAQDSLKERAEQIARIDYRLTRIVPERRYLLDYAKVTFPGQVSYTTYKVPACKVHDKGTIYRIRLMTSRYRQKAEIFRGVEPLYLLQEGGRYIYYTGGFATLAEARACCEVLRKRGFRLPTVVRWVDGQSEEVSEQESSTVVRIEIRGTDRLSEPIRELIHRTDPEREITRVGESFLIGGFTQRSVAEELAREISLMEGSLTVELHEQ